MAQHWQELIPIDRYTVASDGLLHEYDRKVLSFLYQPLIGPICLSLYMTLWAELEENKLWSESSTHHLLMNLLGINLKDIYEARLKLEGIGLLKTYVKKDDNDRSFIYELHPPLLPEQFFLDGMLNVFLYRKIGKNHFARLKRFFSIQQSPIEQEYQNVTRAFQDVFASATPGSIQYLQEVSNDLSPDENQRFIGRNQANTIQISTDSFDFDLLRAGLNESLVPKKALNQKSKEVISNLAFLYNIDAIQMKNLILGAMNEDSEIDFEELRKSARDWYQYINHDQLPMLVERTQPSAHKTVSEPKTQEEQLIYYLETSSPLKVLTDLSGGSEPSKSDLQIIDDVMFKQKLLPGVINVLIQYVMLKTDMKLSKGYVEKIASHWARKQIKTVKEAMELAKNEHRTYLDWSDSKKTGKKAAQKPKRTDKLPDWFEEPVKETFPTSSRKGTTQEIESKKRAIEEKLKAFQKEQ